MFFKENEMLIYPGTDIPYDYQRYNKLAKKISAYKLGEISVQGYHRKNDHTMFPADIQIEFSLWRTFDQNFLAAEQGVDLDKFTRIEPNGYRVAYVIVPRMNTDAADPHPYEYTSEKDSTFEDIMDPRTVIIARSYRGVVAEIAKDLVLDAIEPFQSRYHYWNDTYYADFSDKLFMEMLTEQAIQMFAPNVLTE